MNDKLWAAVVLLLILPAIAYAQMVYYNTEGGRYYHADPHCDTIDQRYWDEMAETTTAYAERLGLRGPCSRCFDEESAVTVSALPAVFAGGYVIAACDEKKKIDYEPVSGSSRGAIYQPAYHWFDFEGNPLGTTQTLWHTALAAVSDRHTIEAIDQTYWLCAVDEKGNRTKLVRLYDGLRGNMEYRALASLEDGGAAAALYEHGGGNMRSTLQRWDAQGNPASEIVLEDFCVNSLQALGDIMVVCGETGQSEDLLLAVSRGGQILLWERVGGAYTMGRFLIALDEDTVACAQSVSAEMRDEETYNWDVQLSMVDVARQE